MSAQLVFLALDGVKVIAQFWRVEDALEFCGARYCLVPFNLTNAAEQPAPLVGSDYRV